MMACVSILAIAAPLPGMGKAAISATARRLNTPIQIDGLLDESAWAMAEIITDFMQIEPENMAPPTERTTVRLLYDDAYLYVAIEAFDSDPQKITRRLARRDDFMGGFRGSADYVSVSLDSQHDHQSANGYLVNASGVQMDFALYNDSQYDGSWNAVWESAVRHHDLGWSVEMKIPFRDLKFSGADDMVWGLSLNRYIQRKNETISWQPRVRGEQGIASLYGHLEGLSAIRPPEKIKLQPYATTGQNISDASSELNFGLDVTYRLGSSATGVLTVNPDFGQVEADPAVVNLTAFETRFDERRPFFVENSGLFNTPLELFYSRRIGAEAATILGAGKLIGKTESGFSYAAIGAATAPVGLGGSTRLAHFNDGLDGRYVIGRAQKDILAGNSSVGLLGTYAGRQESNAASAVGADWRLNLGSNRWSNVGQVVTTQVGGETGLAVVNNLRYKGAKWKGAFLDLSYFGAGVNFDDLGFMTRNDFLAIKGELSARRQDPIGIVRNAELRIGEVVRQNLSGNILEQQYKFDTSIMFLNYWQIRMGLRRRLPVFDDSWAISEGAPVYKIPGVFGGYVGFDSDGRKAFALRLRARGGTDELGAPRWGSTMNLNFRPATFMQGSLGVTVSRRENPVQFMALIEGALGTGALFAWSTTQTVETTLRFEANLNPNISFQVFGQRLDARIDYADYRTLDEPLTDQFSSYNASGRNDRQDFQSVRGTAVLRWEIRPGEIFFLVYSLDRLLDNLTTDISNSQAVFIKYNLYLTR
ncbi:MAG: carbohydrate binding family 9 domain-containing protein [Candidatus Marinimicrobia bacterium]|nr:carbohydrate binding family 9 domain-containing protein [Candidatus Neomarinimicrobiota bacterium]